MPEYVDICFNFGHDSFRRDRELVLERARQAGVRRMMMSGLSVADSEKSLRLAEQYSAVGCELFSAVGVHPHAARYWCEQDREKLVRLSAHPVVLAIGETGLDYFRNFSPRAEQLKAFSAQIRIAQDVNMPLFFHQRDAHDDFMSTLKTHGKLPNAVVHCFSSDRRCLEAYLELDFYIGITGWICDERRGLHLRELVKIIPPNRLMIETDAPYLVPKDLSLKHRGARNEPAYLPHIAQVIAKCLEMPAAQLAAQTCENAGRFFNFPKARLLSDA